MRYLLKPQIDSPYFAQTTAAQQVRMAVGLAIESRCAVRVLSNPGRGKSFALWRICEELGGDYCLVSAEQKGSRGFWEMILSAIGLQHDAKTRGGMADLVMWRLDSRRSDSPRLLVVDEYQRLEPEYQRELLALQETCAIALVLSGNTVGLRRSSADLVALEQIEDRIWHNIAISPLNADDCKAIGVEFNVEGRDAYDVLVEFGTANNARQLARLLIDARALAGKSGSIRLEHISAVLGPRRLRGADLRSLAESQKL